MDTKIKMPEWAFVEAAHDPASPAQGTQPYSSPYSALFDELGFLSSDDCAFLTDIFQRFPRVQAGFNHFLGFEPEDRLAEAVQKLKAEPRAAWPLMGVPPTMVQSVAGHHADAMKLAFMVASQGAEPAHIARMMAVHDLAECVTGDFISAGRYKDPIIKSEKQHLERIALKMLLQDFPDEDTAQEITALWEEYETGTSPQAKLAHDIDKLELVMQAQYYGHLWPDLKPAFQEMWDAAERSVKTSEGRQWLTQLTHASAPHALKTHGHAVFTFPWDL
jgi:putative hydrolase of HD superfamily